MKKNLAVKTVAVTLGVAMCVGTLSIFAGCTKDSGDTLTVMMSDSFDGLFNPFFSTSGADSSVVEMTQISMLTTDADGIVACGDKEAVVVKDYSIVENANDTTTYNFVIKNGIKFSDGVPLTMNDILFNMYVYLDPAYTGSSTMYSTDIVGLQRYRTQQETQNENLDSEITQRATSMAQARIQELIDVFTMEKNPNGTYDVDDATMKSRIESWTCSVGFKDAIGEQDEGKAREQLMADYQLALETFKAELETDYESAREAYTEEPYKSTGKFDEIVSFMYAESSFTNFIELEYEVTSAGLNKNKITKVTPLYDASKITTKELAINHVYNTMTTNFLHQVLTYYGTGTKMLNTFISKAKDVFLHSTLQDGELAYKNISGIVSLGHSSSAPDTIEVNGNNYKIAKQHNENGTPVNSDEYDVLSITINKVDPKAIWNFGFQVAPYHYYSDPSKYPVDIANDKFGVEWSSFDFMSGVLQGTYNGVQKNKIPVGAGSYVATDNSDKDNPSANGFYNNNYVYYKANENFIMGAPKIKRFRYKYVSSSNAIGNLKDGSVDFIEPQFTTDSLNQLKALESKGITSTSSWQLGYGYIGVNAGKVPNINIRKAIMSAMNTALALQYYDSGTAVNIAYPMSIVSWAYPREPGVKFDPNDPTKGIKTNNGHDYMQYTGAELAKKKIRDYMALAGVGPEDSSLKITFTIAGSNLTEHPLYNTFVNAMQLLNSCGWNVTVSPDTNALVKLSTGSLSVWAAAWSSTIDPDMYQVYHKSSTATSVLSWGYRQILGNQTSYQTEYGIVNTLSGVIEAARETNDVDKRTELYEEAMGYVLDLAVEMPAYQRQTLYAYNENRINRDTLPKDINSYSSPLSRIWELELK